jgi:hypothetical protein
MQASLIFSCLAFLAISHQALSMGEGTKVTEVVEKSGQEAAGVAVGSAETRMYLTP